MFPSLHVTIAICFLLIRFKIDLDVGFCGFGMHIGTLLAPKRECVGTFLMRLVRDMSDDLKLHNDNLNKTTLYSYQYDFCWRFR